MLGGCVSRAVSHHFRDCDLHFHFTLTYCTFQTFHLSSPRPLKPCSPDTAITKKHNRVSSNYRCFGTPSKPPGEIPLLFDCFSQQEDEREILSDGTTAVAGGIVALGKFDALHIGHRELAIQASKAGPPFLLSFVGMEKVLGWEPRGKIVYIYSPKAPFDEGDCALLITLQTILVTMLRLLPCDLEVTGSILEKLFSIVGVGVGLCTSIQPH